MATDDRDDFDDRYPDDLPPARRRMTTDEARSRVRGPAIGLILIAIISLGMIAVSVIQYPTLPELFEEQAAELDKKLDADPKVSPEQKQQARNFLKTWQNAVLKVTPGLWAIAGVSSLFILFAAIKMMSLSGRGLGITASILAMIPCVSGCCCVLGLPVGIWTLIVLSNPGVKAAFAANRFAGGSPEVLDSGFDDIR